MERIILRARQVICFGCSEKQFGTPSKHKNFTHEVYVIKTLPFDTGQRFHCALHIGNYARRSKSTGVRCDGEDVQRR